MIEEGAAALEMAVEMAFQLGPKREQETKICTESKHSRVNNAWKTQGWSELGVLGRAQPAAGE